MPGQTSPANPRPTVILKRAGVTPSKAKGQNFLVQPAVADLIVGACELNPGDTIVEIGPGLGILSERFLAAAPLAGLWMIEYDAKLANRLRVRFDGVRNVTIIESDALTLDLGAAIKARPIKIAGNLPFNIASALLQKFCSYSREVSRMILMFQREVAERIRARPGAPAYGALSVFTALYWETREHFRVAAGSFHPRPRVDAEVIAFNPRRELEFEPSEESSVRALVRASFANRRKTIRNSLVGCLRTTPAAIEAALSRASIEPGIRAERLAASDFIRLTRELMNTDGSGFVKGR